MFAALLLNFSPDWEHCCCNGEKVSNFDSSLYSLLILLRNVIVYYVPRRTMRVIAWRVTMLARDRSQGVADAYSRRSWGKAETNRGAISPASIVASLLISRIVCIGTYSILCDFGANTSFYAYTAQNDLFIHVIIKTQKRKKLHRTVYGQKKAWSCKYTVIVS